MYSTSKRRTPAVVHLQTDRDAAAREPTSFGELMECLDIIPGILQMPQGTSQPGSSHMRLSSGKPQSDTGEDGPAPPAMPDPLHMLKVKPVEPVTFDDCM